MFNLEGGLVRGGQVTLPGAIMLRSPSTRRSFIRCLTAESISTILAPGSFVEIYEGLKDRLVVLPE